MVLTARGATFMMARSIWDLATPGSPTSRQLMSPLRCVPLARLRSRPAGRDSQLAAPAFLLPLRLHEKGEAAGCLLEESSVCGGR